MSNEPTNCQQCGNPLNPQELENNQAMCDRCWAVRSDYLWINDYDEFDEEEDDDIFTCPYCYGQLSISGGWSTCTCDEDEDGYVETHDVTEFDSQFNQELRIWRKPPQ